MITGRVSIIVPSRNERFLIPTLRDLLAKARGDVEVIVVLDGYWPGANDTEPLPPELLNDPRVKFLHRGAALGMRPAINAAVQMATGEFLLKCDAHVLVDEGFDIKLKADLLEDNWLLVPRRYPLDPENWKIDDAPRKDRKYPVDYHSLSEPFHKYGDSVPGLHGTPWRDRRDARLDIELDDELASQGSFWFMSRKHWDRLGPMRSDLYGVFWFESQELSLKTWCMGGAQKVTKRTFYAHLFKGSRYGRGYNTRGMGHEAGTAYNSWFWLTDQPFHGKARTFRSLIEQFSPVPTWTDVDAIFDRAYRELRNPYAVAA